MKDITLKMNDEDVWLLLCAAFRYSLGRMTYMPHSVSAIIRANKDKLTEWQRRQLAEEVREHERQFGNIGMDFDTEMWHRFAAEMDAPVPVPDPDKEQQNRDRNIDLTLRECPFCGCPAEIVTGDPFTWMPEHPTKMIRCINEYGCPGYRANIRFQPDNESSEACARAEWNTRRKKNKNYFKTEKEE